MRGTVSKKRQDVVNADRPNTRWRMKKFLSLWRSGDPRERNEHAPWGNGTGNRKRNYKNK